jgi:hypothetical protein
MAEVSWTNGRFILTVDTTLQKTTIVRVSDGVQTQYRDSTVQELQDAQAIIDGSQSTVVSALREELISAYQALRNVNSDRSVTFQELADVMPAAIAVLRQFKDLGTQDLLTVRYAIVLIGEIVETVLWAMKDERDKFKLVTSEVLSLRQEMNAIATRVSSLEQP